MIDLLTQYNNMVESMAEVKDYSHVTMAEDNESYIAFGEPGIKIKSPMIDLMKSSMTVGSIYVCSDITIGGRSLLVFLDDNRNIKDKVSFLEYELEKSKMRIEALEDKLARAQIY